MNAYAGADWVRAIPGAKVSPFGALVADMLGYAYQGIYHLPGVRVVDFAGDFYVRVPVAGDMATFDNDKLTVLVLLAHRCAVRLAIEPQNQHMIALVFHARTREGDYFHRHPTIAAQTQRFEADCYLPEADAAPEGDTP